MLRKIVWAVVVLVVLALAGGTAWFFMTYHSINDYLALSKLKTVVAPQTEITQGVDKVVCTALQQVTAVNAQNITIESSSEPTHNFNLTDKTLVFSLASAGQAGKTIRDVTVGSTVIICPTKADRLAAGWIIFQRDPSTVPTATESAHSIDGKVTALTDTSVTITPTNTASSSVTIMLSPSPKIVTTVINGQVGRTMVVGDMVGASGLVTSGGKTTATMILLAPVYPQ